MKIRRIGQASIQTIVELCGPGFKADRMFPRFDPALFAAEAEWMYPTHVEPGTDRLVGSIHAWLVRTPHHTILIDTCLGNDKERSAKHWRRLDTPFLQRLAAAGVAPEQVDFVMCTHLHVDHVGWNTRLQDGRWVPTFPNAKYIFSEREYRHWEAERARLEPGEVNDGAFDDSVLPVVEAGLSRLVGSDYQPDPLLLIHDAPGHTPGSIALELRDREQSALFTGDIMHHPIQVYHPDWSSQFCWDPEQSARTRRRILEKCVEHRHLLCPAHFPGANAGFIAPKGHSFQIRWDEP